MTAFVVIFWIGMLGTGFYYWFNNGRKDEFLSGRLKTGFVAVFWPVYLIVLFLNRQNAATRQVKADEAKKRILD